MFVRQRQGVTVHCGGRATAPLLEGVLPKGEGRLDRGSRIVIAARRSRAMGYGPSHSTVTAEQRYRALEPARGSPLPRTGPSRHTPVDPNRRPWSSRGWYRTWRAATDRLRRWNVRYRSRPPIIQIVLAALAYLAAVTLVAFLAISAYLDHATLAKRSSAHPNFAPTAASRSHVTGAR
jgi:hypothetical protein